MRLLISTLTIAAMLGIFVSGAEARCVASVWSRGSWHCVHGVHHHHRSHSHARPYVNNNQITVQPARPQVIIVEVPRHVRNTGGNGCTGESTVNALGSLACYLGFSLRRCSPYLVVC